jgi:hypothetical protein
MVQFQKFIRNLLFSLHGHNLHRQQQQHRTENVDFWRVTLVLYLCVWLLGSPDTDIVYVHLATDMECGFIAEDESGMNLITVWMCVV